MIMGEAEGRVELDPCMHHSTKPDILGVDGTCSPEFADEIVVGPVTPFPDRENQIVPSPSGQSEEGDPRSAFQTPLGSTFDPFAPGPEELMLAPKKKMLKKSCPPIRRKLNFNSFCDSKECLAENMLEETQREEGFLETNCRSFLDVLVPASISMSEEVAVSDGGVPEAKCSIRKENSMCREEVLLCESYLSKVGISGADDVCVSKAVNDTVLGRPHTPFPQRKNLLVSSPSGQTDEGDLESNCQTPREGTFDPFAPVSEGQMMFAPKKKLLKGAYAPVQRKLDFDSCCDSEEDSAENMSEESSMEEIFLVTVYKSLLDVIISCQVRESIGESLLSNSAPPDGLKTPVSLPLLNGIAESCPGAPVRPSSKSRKFSVNICRKLEF